jgi:chromosome segregation and condensation protein ScpB
MHSVVQRCAVVILLTCSALMAQSYRGVYVGQRGDLLPPEFSQAKRGEYIAQFANERIVVTVNGALVTGFVVIPDVPITLAEAIAKYGVIADTTQMRLLLDLQGDPQGLVDPIKRISYITRSFGPDGIVNSVGYYDENTALLIWTDYADAALLQALATAAQNVSLQDLNSRPRLANVAARARYMMDQSLKSARERAGELNAMLSKYQQSCAQVVSDECQQARRTQGPSIVKTADQFRFALKQTNSVYATNAEMFGETMPPELRQLNQIADRLLPQVPVILPGQQ